MNRMITEIQEPVRFMPAHLYNMYFVSDYPQREEPHVLQIRQPS